MAKTLLDRAFGILELVASHHGGLRLQAIANELDITKSAAHRLLAELIRLGYTRHDEEAERYVLTNKLLSLSFRYLAGSGVLDLAQPILDELAARTGDLVRLGVVNGDSQVWVAKAQGAPSGLRYDPDMGAEVPLFCTATGHAWLACLPEEEALAMVARQGFTALEERGPKAPRSIEAVRERLLAARQLGYASVYECSAPGTAAVAVAVRRPVDGRVLGTLSVGGPSLRLTEARLKEFAPLVQEAAAELGSIWIHHAIPAEMKHSI